MVRYPFPVRTTLSLDDDVAAAVQRLREERHIGLSDAVNELIRAGLTAPAKREPFRQRTADLGLRVDVSDVADALEHLDGPEAR
jgi:Arc/MetJ family transcription regulator